MPKRGHVTPLFRTDDKVSSQDEIEQAHVDWNNQFILVNKSSIFSLISKKLALKNSRAFSTTKVTP